MPTRRLTLIAARSAALAAALACVLGAPTAARGAALSGAGRCEHYLTETDILASHIAEAAPELTQLYAAYESESANWRAFLAEGPQHDGRSVHIIHQTRIKELNEQLWNMTGTEDYLETFHEQLAAFLSSNPALGSLLHDDYKNHFVASALDAATFDALVVKPVTQRVARAMSAKRPEIDWSAWVEGSVFHGAGASPAEAYFHVALARARFIPDAKSLGFEEWRAQALARRVRLTAFARSSGIDWSDLLAIMHQTVGRGTNGDDALSAWLGTRDPMGEMRAELERYCDDLQVADFQPLPDPGVIPKPLEDFVEARASGHDLGARAPWSVERRAFFTMLHGAQSIVATDVKGLSGVGRAFQDRWIASGARLETLPAVYEQSTAALGELFEHLRQELQAAAGAARPGLSVRVYWSGDDALWILPALDAQARARVAALFERFSAEGETDRDVSLKLYHSNLIPLAHGLAPAAAAADALVRARQSLFAIKSNEKHATHAAGDDTP